jgi:hypothetical protein
VSFSSGSREADPVSDATSADHPHEDRRLATIRGLLAKAEATDYPEEAEAFFAKASELISRWAIDEAMIWAARREGAREQPDELQIVVHSPYLAQKAVLLGTVATAHGCRAVRLVAGSGSRSEVISVVGFPSELRWVETLATSLLVQLTSAMLAGSPRGVSASESASWRRSFIIGFAEEVGARLTADRETAASERAPDTTGGVEGAGSPSGTPSVAVVLASRADEVDSDFRKRHPYVRSSWASSGRSRTGRRAGRQAGREASLSRNGIGGRRSLGSGRRG